MDVVITDDQIEEMKGLLDQLWDKAPDGPDDLTEEEQGMFEILSWLLEGSDKPELD